MNEKNTNESGSVLGVIAAFALGVAAGAFLATRKKSVPVETDIDLPCEEVNGEEYEDLWELQDEEEGIKAATTEEITEESDTYSF